jgi:hypothetical protein
VCFCDPEGAAWQAGEKQRQARRRSVRLDKIVPLGEAMAVDKKFYRQIAEGEAYVTPTCR